MYQGTRESLSIYSGSSRWVRIKLFKTELGIWVCHYIFRSSSISLILRIWFELQILMMSSNKSSKELILIKAFNISAKLSSSNSKCLIVSHIESIYEGLREEITYELKLFAITLYSREVVFNKISEWSSNCAKKYRIETTSSSAFYSSIDSALRLQIKKEFLKTISSGMRKASRFWSMHVSNPLWRGLRNESKILILPLFE